MKLVGEKKFMKGLKKLNDAELARKYKNLGLLHARPDYLEMCRDEIKHRISEEEWKDFKILEGLEI